MDITVLRQLHWNINLSMVRLKGLFGIFDIEPHFLVYQSVRDVPTHFLTKFIQFL